MILVVSYSIDLVQSDAEPMRRTKYAPEALSKGRCFVVQGI